MKISNVFFGQRPFKNEPVYAPWNPSTIQAVDSFDKIIKWKSSNAIADIPTSSLFGFGTHGNYFQDLDGKVIVINKSANYELTFSLGIETNATSGIGTITIESSEQDPLNPNSRFSSSYGADEQFLQISHTADLGYLKKGSNFRFILSGIFEDRWGGNNYFILKEKDRNIRN